MHPYPTHMSAIAIENEKGDADALHLRNTTVPVPGSHEILVRVAAAGVNRPDVWQRLGSYPPPPGASTILGLEVAGEVVAVGADAGRWRVGDRVAALLSGGGYAEYVTVDARHALPLPSGPNGTLDFVQAAALPETVFTVFANVFEAGRLRAGETLMVHGATSGIGATAIAMARAAGAKVIATSRNAEKADIATRQLGADLSIDTSNQDFAEIATRAGGVDVILDMVGGNYFVKNLASLKRGGRLVQISFQAGDTVQANLRPIMVKNLTVTGSTLRARSAEEKARLAAQVEAIVWPWIAMGTVTPRISRIFPLGEASKAHRFLESGEHVGKVVLVTSKTPL